MFIYCLQILLFHMVRDQPGHDIRIYIYTHYIYVYDWPGYLVTLNIYSNMIEGQPLPIQNENAITNKTWFILQLKMRNMVRSQWLPLLWFPTLVRQRLGQFLHLSLSLSLSLRKWKEESTYGTCVCKCNYIQVTRTCSTD